MRFDTLAVHGGERKPGPEGSVVFPIFQGTVFTSEPGEDYHDIKYHRLNSTPSQRYLHDKLAALEGAEAAVATSSGMAAVTTILHTLLGAGDHILVSDVLYGGTYDFLTGNARRLGWEYTMIDPQDPASWAVRPDTKAILVPSGEQQGVGAPRPHQGQMTSAQTSTCIRTLQIPPARGLLRRAGARKPSRASSSGASAEVTCKRVPGR